MRKIKVLFSALMILVAVVVSVSGSAQAAATSKSLSTNFTLVNLGASDATVVVDYKKTDGTTWGSVAKYTNFSIPKDGGQMIVRQYDTSEPGSVTTPGQGSVVISSSSPLGAIVQIQARGQTPTMGAYNGMASGSTTNYLPLLQKKNTTGSGVVSSQIIIQNADSGPLDVSVVLTGSDGTNYPKTFPALAPGVSVYYDLTDDTALPASGWVGSGVVSSTGKLAVVSNLFLGADGLMTYNAFQMESKTSTWFIPLITSRLNNGQSASVAVQNVSGAALPVGDVELNCKNTSTTGAATVVIASSTEIKDKAAYYFNPVVDKVNFPDNWVGSCTVASKSGKDLVAFAQVRYTNGVGDAAAYEGIPGTSTGTTLFVPLVIKRLSNGAATTTTIQNLSNVDTTVTLTYTASAEYTGTVKTLTKTGIPLPAKSSIIRNYRLAASPASDPNLNEPDLPEGWVGTLKVTSGQPVQAYIAITSLVPSGDSLMAHLGFTQ